MKETLTYRDLFSEKNFLKLFFANSISRFGDSIDAIAYSWMVYEITKSPTWIAIIFGINALPSILFQPICGVLVERMNKKKLMVLTDFGRAFIVFLTALLLMTGALNPWYLMLFTFINSTFEAFRIPAGLAIFPQMLPPEKYAYGQGLSGTASNIIQLVGTASAGILIATLGTAGVIMIDALTFLASGIILMFLKLKPTTSSLHTLTMSSFFTDFKEGFAYLKQKHIVFLLCLLAGVINVLIVPLGALQAVYVSEHLHLDANGLSLMSISLLLGLAIGSYILPLVMKKLSKFMTFIFFGLIYSFAYVGLAFIPLLHSKYLLIVILFLTVLVFGVAVSLLSGVVQISFMEHVEENYLARTGSIMNSFAMALMPIGSFLLGGLTTFLSIPTLFLLCGCGCIIFYILCSLNTTLKQL